MTRRRNAFQLVRPRATAQLPPDKQAKDHPRKRGADLLAKDISIRTATIKHQPRQ